MSTSQIEHQILLTLNKLKCATRGVKGGRDRAGAQDMRMCVCASDTPATKDNLVSQRVFSLSQLIPPNHLSTH